MQGKELIEPLMARRWTQFGLCLFLGGVAATGFAPLGLWPVLLLCFAVFIMLVRRASGARAAASLGWWFGWGHFSVGMFWIAHAFTYQDKMPEWLGIFAPIGLAIYLAIYPALCAGLAWILGRKSTLAFTLTFAGFWVFTEWLRGTLLTGYPWNPLGVAFIDFGGPAQFVGTYGLSGLVALSAGTLALFGERHWKAGAALLALIIGVTLLTTTARVTTPSNLADRPLLYVVQPNIGQHDKNKAGEGYEALTYAKLAHEMRHSVGPKLVFWPEAAVPYFFEVEDWARTKVSRLLGPKDILLTGADSVILGPAPLGYPPRPTGYRNSIFVMSADSRLLARYDKSHLVPGGEYLPLRDLLEPIGLSRLVPGDAEFLPGVGPQTITVWGGGIGRVKIGVQICYEIIFPGKVVARDNRPDVIFHPSNDAWYGSWGPPQFLAQARLRALEEGLPVIRSTPTGISAVINADGSVAQSLPLNQSGSIIARLPFAHPPTLFSHFGNALALGFGALLILLGIALARRTR